MLSLPFLACGGADNVLGAEEARRVWVEDKKIRRPDFIGAPYF